MSEVSQEFLKECFDYDPDTGILTWRERPLSHFASDHSKNSFNARQAGSVAGSLNVKGYLVVGFVGKSHYVHRVVWVHVYGEAPKNIDHINGSPIDNRISNLRSVGQYENTRNSKIGSANTSGHIGVTWNKKFGKWQAQITNNYKLIYLGCFVDFDEACATRKEAEIKYNYHPNHGRES